EIAQRQERFAAVEERVGVVRLGGEGAVVGGDRLVVTPQLSQRLAAMLEQFRLIGSKRKRLVESRECVSVTAEQQQSIAVTVEPQHVVWCSVDGLAETIKGFFVTPELYQREPAIAEDHRMVASHLDRAIEGRECLVGAIQQHQRIAPADERLQVIRLDRKRPI